MSIKRIDVFIPLKNFRVSQYGALHHFTRKMHEAFQLIGINSRLLQIDEPSYFQKIIEDPPDCTFSFNAISSDSRGLFFCDRVGIPHISYLLDSPHKFLHMLHSRYMIFTCVDRIGVDLLRALDFSHVHFMPHGIESSILLDSQLNREYDVVMLGSCIDYEEILASWRRKYPAPFCTVLEEAAEIALIKDSIPYYQAFMQVLYRHENHRARNDLSTVNLIEVLNEIEMYIRGKERVLLLNAIKEARVDIFGSGMSGWKKYLNGQTNIHIHEGIPFEQALEVMKRSKIVLNSSPSFKQGSHERVFAALACGALPITNDNAFLREQFHDGASIAFFRYPQWAEVNQTINEYLADPLKWGQVVDKGREIVMKSHTWEQRAAQLVKKLPSILKKIREQ